MGAPFLFGKLPAHGDFVARGLSDEAERLLDDWASREIETARTALGDDFDAAHDAAPPWGFIAGPGVLGEGWRWGAIAASVDTAGRRFVVVAGLDGLDPADAAFLGLNGVQAAETAIRTMLIERLDVDAAMDLLADGAAAGGPAEAGRVLAAAPSSGVWWSLAEVTPPAAGDVPPAGLVSSAIERVAALLKEAA